MLVKLPPAYTVVPLTARVRTELFAAGFQGVAIPVLAYSLAIAALVIFATVYLFRLSGLRTQVNETATGLQKRQEILKGDIPQKVDSILTGAAKSMDKPSGISLTAVTRARLTTLPCWQNCAASM